MQKDYVVLEKKSRHIRLPMSDILYITTAEGQPHQLEFVTPTKEIRIYGTLSEIEEKYTSFIRCHRKCIVNTMNIKEVDKRNKRIYFVNNEAQKSCPVSRRQYKDVLALLG